MFDPIVSSKLVWKLSSAGTGYSTPAVVGDRILIGIWFFDAPRKGAPLLLFILSGVAAGYIYGLTHQYLNAILFGYDADTWGQAGSCLLFWGLAILAIPLMIRIRKRHRVLAPSYLQWEILAGLLILIRIRFFDAPRKD